MKKKIIFILIFILSLYPTLGFYYRVENGTSYYFTHTYEDIDRDHGNIVINHTKVTNSVDFLWEVKYGWISSTPNYIYQNFSLRDGCWNAYNDRIQLVFRGVRLSSANSGSSLFCWSDETDVSYGLPGGNWKPLFNSTSETHTSGGDHSGNTNQDRVYDNDYSTWVWYDDNSSGTGDDRWEDSGNFLGARFYEDAGYFEIDDKEIKLLPDNPRGNQDLQGWVNCTGGYGQKYNITYEFYQNGALFSNGTLLNVSENISVNVANVSSSNTVITDTWKFKAKCEHGTDIAGFDSDTEDIRVYCGADLNGEFDYTMTSDLNCDGYSGEVIMNTFDYNGTFDCAGYSIIGIYADNSIDAFSDDGSGASASPMTIKNCNLINTSGMGAQKPFVTFDNINITNLCGIGFGDTASQISSSTIKNTNIFSTVDSCSNSDAFKTLGVTDIFIVNNSWTVNSDIFSLTFDEDNWTVYNNKFIAPTIFNTGGELGTVSNIYLNGSYDCSSPNIIGGECQGGNYYSTYTGLDVDGDGIGDTIRPFKVFSYSGTDYYDYFPLTNNTELINISILTPENGGTINHQSHVPFNFTIGFEESNISNCWYNLNNGTNVSVSCAENQITSTFVDTSPGSNTIYLYVNTTNNVIVSNSSTFTTQNDSIAPAIVITSPDSGQNITKIETTENFGVTFTIVEAGELSQCTYNHYTSGGSPSSEVPFDCSIDVNSISISVGYFGTHTVVITANDTENNIGTDNVTFNIIEQEIGGGGGGGGDEGKEVEVPVPFFIREKTLENTCGYDADQDGLICDPNEDWISCPEDCEFPQLDELLCLGGGECVWREAWFLKMLFGMLLITTIYLVYTDLTVRPRKRKIFK